MAETQTLAETLPVHGMGRVGTPWWGMLCLYATEGVLFAYLIFSYAYLGTQGGNGWPPGGPPNLLLGSIATIALLASSVTAEWGKRLARRRAVSRARGAYGVTIALGILFVMLSLKEWSDKPFAFSDNAYSSIYFTLTGLHLAHVVVGLTALAVALVWSLAGRIHDGHDQHRTLVTYYWHFVDAVWLFVFATIYISPHLTGGG